VRFFFFLERSFPFGFFLDSRSEPSAQAFSFGQLSHALVFVSFFLSFIGGSRFVVTNWWMWLTFAAIAVL